MSTTPLQSRNYPVYADPAATMSGGTPLVLAVSRTGRLDEYHVTVKLQLLQAYERAIFELQQQLTHYKTLLDMFMPAGPAQTEDLRLENAAPLNAASIRLIDSIASARIPTSALRGMDEEGEV
jgi:hypothetical protein